MQESKHSDHNNRHAVKQPSIDRAKTRLIVLSLLWVLHALSVVLLYRPLVSVACDLLHSPATLAEIAQKASQAKYYYLYLSIPFSGFLMLELHRSCALKSMMIRLWLKKYMIFPVWILGAVLMSIIYYCTAN